MDALCENCFISRDNGATWLHQSFNVFNCVDGELYNGGEDWLTIYKVSKVDNKISSAPYTEYVNLPPVE